ncbi:response regulator [Methylobacterium nodulans]|uniref:Response regulator receiver protein n=1 Tax=Methylobacterium nodulans (strain LMG 21967 / CNCM I-2342 / ORS 2060) TaxID=460265 RepID=B8IU78_METNO|nr:response regulator [Methylobacterium nodulans]ACL55123.1 response regulator receiver protein [Methylobacterium nodulans ORS 2060]
MGQAIFSRGIALVVEDDPHLRDLAAALLEETDLRVVEAASGEEALDYLRERADEVAFVFADVRLPNLVDGVDLARMIALKWPWIRMVVTSGAAGDRIDYLPRSATYMPKPWRALDVLVAAEQAIARNS